MGEEKPKGDVTNAYQQHLNSAAQWIEKNEILALTVDFPELVHNPDSQLKLIANFLGCESKMKAMRSVISPSLHRVKIQGLVGV